MNIIKTNYHMHTNFCDGTQSAEEMVLAAIEKGFSIIGFSSHSMYPFASTWHIAPREHKAYVAEIRRFAKIYADKIEILCGFEADFFPRVTVPDSKNYEEFSPDFLLGSVHYISTEKGSFGVDDTVENVKRGVQEIFGGDARAAVCEYFSLERQMLREGNFAILGHCDLFRKRNGVLKLFNENETWYREEIKATAKEIARAGVIAEINTGAIARGAMDDVYPSSEMLSLLHENGVPITINSDAHRGEDLDCAFDRARAAAKKAGYSEVMYLTCGSSGIETRAQPLG